MIRKIKANGIVLCFDDTMEEQKKPLFLYHGLSRNKEAMYYFRDRLSDAFRVITVDARGHGGSSRTPSYSLDDHAEDVLALADALGSSKISILGFSMGSYLSLRAMEKAPARFEKGILVCPKASSVSSSSMSRLLEEKGYDIRTISPEKRKEIVRPYMYAPDTIAKIRAGTFTEPDNDSLGIQLTAEEKDIENASLSGFDLTGDIHKVTCPVLVITAEYDGINPPKEGEKLAGMLSAGAYLMIPNAGHMVPYEKQDSFFAAVKEFLIKE